MSVQIQATEDTSPPAPRVVVVMGVSGCGKSTVGALLALHLRWEFEDADWFSRLATSTRYTAVFRSPTRIGGPG